MPEVIDVYFSDCPNCRQPMRVREILVDNGAHLEEENCSTCDHFFVVEIDNGKENECYA